MEQDKRYKPELLCPAGDREALCAAIAGGADAVYFGTELFNARIRAKNFTLPEAKEAITLCHAYGVKTYITLNIAIYEREIPTLLDYVNELYSYGADALIVSDLGVMSLLSGHFPDLELHASTQCTVHNLDGVNFLFKRGCKRVVVARELDKENIEYIARNADAEIEAFVHGAHCMSVSGQCLMSYAMGGRSGNRGECAQPCRLPYKIGKEKTYPLSLKDMSLSNHMKDICESGVASLKIEGRMKSPDYVYGVACKFRSLIDGKRNASSDEIKELSSIFSRQGFTDGYYTARIDSRMLGIRSEENKEQTKSAATVIPEPKKRPISMYAELTVGKPSRLTVKTCEKSVTVYGDIVEEARTAPLSREDIVKSLSKLGGTPFISEDIRIEKSDSIMIRISSLNALRREAIDKLLYCGREKLDVSYSTTYRKYKRSVKRTALFTDPSKIPEDVSYFDIVYVYLDRYAPSPSVNGICMPPVIFDSQWAEIEKMLSYAKEKGVKYALATNISQIERLKKHGFTVFTDYRFNVFNRPCVDYLLSEGVEGVMLSPELTLKQSEAMSGNSLIVYGKIPVMTTHKCIIKDTAGCDKCRLYLKDRMDASFFCEGIYGHLNIIYNSVPIYMADKTDTLSAFSHHFIFTDESRAQCEEIINAYKNGYATDKKIKRIK